MSNIIDLSKLPVSDSSQVVNIIALNEGGNIIKTDFDAYTKSEIDEKLANVDVDLTGYATEGYVDNRIDVVYEQMRENHYTKSEVDGIIAEIPTGGGDVPFVTWNISGRNMTPDEWGTIVSNAEMGIGAFIDYDYAYKFSGFATVQFQGVKTITVTDKGKQYFWSQNFMTGTAALIQVVELGGGNADVDLSDYYTKSEVDTKLEEVVAGDLDLSGYYTKEETDELISNIDIPTGGNGGLYILEPIDGYEVFEYTVAEGDWQRNYHYQTFVEYSTTNQSKNYEVIQAILDGRCQSVVYKKLKETQELLVSSENGIETYRSNNIYQYLPCSFEIGSCDTFNDTIIFTALLDEHYLSGGDEYVLSVVLRISDASEYSNNLVSLYPDMFCEIYVDGNNGYAISDYSFIDFTNNTNRNLRVVITKYNEDGMQSFQTHIPASFFMDEESDKRVIYAIDGTQLMTWTNSDAKDGVVYPTIKSLEPQEIDLTNYYTKSQVDGISKLKNYYLKKDIYTKTEIDTKLDALVLGEGGEINLNNYYTKSETDSLVNAIDGVYVQNGYGFNILNYPKVKEAFETQTPVFVDGRDGLISVSVKAKVNSNGDMTGAYAFGWIDENTIVEWDMSEGHTDVNGTVRTVSSGGDGIYTLYYPQNYTIENYNEETGESNNENYYYSNSDRQKHNADVAKAIKNGDVKALYLQIPREFYSHYDGYPIWRTEPIWMYIPVAYRCDGIADDYIRVTGVAMKSEEGNLDELYTIGWRTSDDGANYGYYETQITTGGSSSGSGSVEDYASIYNPTIYSPNIQGEMTFSEDYEDTASGIACGYKMNRANINNIWVKNLHLGTNGETVKVTSSDADATTVYAEFTTTGIKENGTLLSEKYVLKSDYDALLARIEALENK